MGPAAPEPAPACPPGDACRGGEWMTASLMYHDLVDPGGWDASGFPGPSAASYKFEWDEYERQLRALSGTGLRFPRVDALDGEDDDACLLTFDDGGCSAVEAARRLEQHGMVGHFLVTGERIGTPGFLGAADVRALAASGHVIGSHSHTHPPDISRLDARALAAEWESSVSRLSQILGHAVDVASVPGGFHSTLVARSAARAGIRHLFTSEPTTSVARIDGCRIHGRYALQRGATPELVAALAVGRGGARARQWLLWNLKKPAKRFVGPAYRWARRRAFGGA
ncbi:polysaccharide deacetylase family protein [Alkalisalibacterium limincola]|uniref:Polysaccharide deacetylase family protein n=2 Tax=Alkalisalibacterium limincola TaxID=2699169 RepID=A0A5C8KWW8_9GAMM|nr:polysaccharide deacetylase family protein [Alkalisalibacterium limincola]